MTLKYHGTPITPGSVLSQLAGRNFCVSYAAPSQVARCHEIGQSVLLDNGAFTFWRTNRTPNWIGYCAWAEEWLDWPTTWAVIPDVIDGTEEENDRLLEDWHQLRIPKGAPVWHMNESFDRLKGLCQEYERVCIGSSGAFSVVDSPAWHHRMDQAMNALCGSGPVPVWLHMLRGMALSGSEYPFASVDSTDVAQNHHRDSNPDVLAMALRWDSLQCKPYWTEREQLELEAA